MSCHWVKPIKNTRQIVYPSKLMIFIHSIERIRSNCATIVLARFVRQWDQQQRAIWEQSFRRKFLCWMIWNHSSWLIKMTCIQSLCKNHLRDVRTELIWNHSHWEAYLIVLEMFQILDMLEVEQNAIICCLWPTELHPVPQTNISAIVCSKKSCYILVIKFWLISLTGFIEKRVTRSTAKLTQNFA